MRTPRLLARCLARLETDWLAEPPGGEPILEPVKKSRTVEVPSCPRCGGTLHAAEPCDPCLACRDRLPIADRVTRLGEMSGGLRSLILRCKFRRDVLAAEELGRRLAAATRRGGWIWHPFDVVCPMPMPWIRRWQRGIDHAREIAGVVAAELGLPLIQPLRHRGGTPRSRQDRRRRSIRRMRPAWGWRPGDLQDLRVFLVDDVLTTGHSLREASAVLRGLGARGTWAVVAAVTPDPRRGGNASDQENCDQGS